MKSPQPTIKFYSTAGDFGEFSNFADFPILLEGHRWPTSEHYFQAKKFADRAYQKRIRMTPSPMRAAILGRDRKQKIRPDWGRVKLGIMHDAVMAKFTQHTELRELLLATGDAQIVEHTPNDDFWGDGGNGLGRNMLGRILMKVRAELGSKNDPSRLPSPSISNTI
jgi:ribA/ribD-fused uncharacterized protein